MRLSAEAPLLLSMYFFVLTSPLRRSRHRKGQKTPNFALKIVKNGKTDRFWLAGWFSPFLKPFFKNADYDVQQASHLHHFIQ
jgi:hypothetical protein